MYQLTIVGAGPGSRDFMLPKGKKALENAGYVFADRRYMDLVPHERREAFGKISQVPFLVKNKLKECSVAVIVSGDPLFYSLTRLLCAHIPRENIEIIPGISSVNYMAAKCKKTVEKAVFLSSHGKEVSVDVIADALKNGRDIYMLCDNTHGPDWLAGKVCALGMYDLPMAAGSCLSYENEQIIEMNARSMAEWKFSPLCVAAAFGSDYKMTVPLIKKESVHMKQSMFLMDKDFMRTKVPMTREEIRWIILGKLQLFPGAKVWDIGGGTGSVSVECARFIGSEENGHVFSVERNPEAAALIRSNRDKFHLTNLTVIEGDALTCAGSLPVPDCVFIGGSGKELAPLLEQINQMGSGIRVVTACVTLETLNEALESYDRLKYEEIQAVQISVSKVKPLGNYHMLDTSHPITIFSGRTTGIKQI